MTWPVFVAWFARIVHISSATVMIGAPFFIRFGLMPATCKVLDDESRKRLYDTINRRWRHLVYVIILLFLLSWGYSFFVETRVDGKLITARWHDFSPADKQLYHMLFGIKMIAAFGIFFLASALSGRTAVFAPIRQHARVNVSILLVLAGVVLICATWMRYLPRA